MLEEWKLIDNSFYISNFVNVKTLNGRIINMSNRKSRYLAYKKHPIHRLVAKCFIPNPDNKREVNHKDGNKHNNHVNNLEWVTTSENRIHAFKNKLELPSYGFAGKHHTEETKERISKNNAKYWKGKYRSKESMEKRRQTMIAHGYWKDK